MNAKNSTQIEIDTILSQALELGQTGDFRQALSLSERAFALAADGAHEDAFCDAGIQCGAALGWLGRSEEAIEYVQRILQRVVKRNDQVREARARAVYANILLEVGLDTECYEEASRAASMATSPEQADVLLKAMDLQALVMIFADDFRSAAPLLDEAVMIADQHGFDRVSAMLLMHIGLLNTRIAEGKLEEGDQKSHDEYLEIALHQTEQAIQMARESGNRRIELVGSANLAEFMSDFGRFDEALAWLENWQKMQDIATPGNWVHYYYTLCDFELERGNIDAALKAGHQAIDAAKNISSADNYANAVRRLGRAYEVAGDYKSALEMHKLFHNEFRRRTAEKGRWKGKVDELNQEMERVKALLQDASSDMERLKEEALTDPLTGLANRRAFDQHMEQLYLQCGHKYAIAVLDLDHFKAVNDAFSHVLGDKVLRKVADQLTNGCRGTDLICRIGGEEFALIFSGSTPKQIHQVCERLRTSIEMYNWTTLAEGLEMTASIGVAHATPGHTPAEVFAKADNRLFYAKAKGRNRVVTGISTFEQDESKLASVK
ncbi:sensor domain-containing diguanylate cyclase [Maritalea mediterranea]|uniref:diguanylate cyclase n=1 Tax=Maritalea mediterranea TaxID=2909667 RepID=A0ABS9E926_9HYPH|nr:diguanylate cyclase [Maritalea mediterranea]MCF4098707.1 diguanylate cyclase [Maritalea mediterranea]